jgi:hypothetical protein
MRPKVIPVAEAVAMIPDGGADTIGGAALHGLTRSMA